VLVDASGQLFVVGSSTMTTGRDLAIWSFNAKGKLVTQFGNAAESSYQRQW
jgi:hypothetical protein